MGSSLRDFLIEHRSEVLAATVERLKNVSPGRDERELAIGFDEIIGEIIGTLGNDPSATARSPLSHSAAAARVGGERQKQAFEIREVPEHLGAISESMSRVAARYDLEFSARDYRVFNMCIDGATTAAIEQFSSQLRAETEADATQRMGFLAHELRNAVSTGQLAFQMLKSGHLGINSKTGEIVERSFGRLLNLANQALTSVHLHSRTERQTRSLPVRKLLDEIAQAAAPERGARLRTELALNEDVELDGDEQLFVSAVSNLLQNAFKFTHSSSEVILRAMVDESRLRIEVEDECGGLSPGTEEELFKPYVQRATDRRGVGLGLSITREAVAAHGGEVSALSLPGKGCVFAITMPLRAGATSARSGTESTKPD